MSEEEAEAKACCGPRNNSQAAEEGDILCIGSRCMAWRWNFPPQHMDGRTKPTGYCGLAGKP